MLSTMQDWPLTITEILKHGARIHPDSEVFTFDGVGGRRVSFRETGERSARLAGALRRLGVAEGDRVGTLCWNTQEHLEAYLAVPSMGAVLHPLNLRLFPEQLAYVINHAGDRVIIVDHTLLPVLTRVVNELKGVERYILIGEERAMAADLPGEALLYEELLAGEGTDFAWPQLDERAAAGMCYTTGTTGHPKGVVYSHRSNFLHSFAICSGGVLGLGLRDRLLPIAPMFHANAWGLPYAGWMVGADFVMPGRHLQAEPLCRLIATERPTFACAVPTIWNDVLRYAEQHEVDFSSLRLVLCGGAAVPQAMIENFAARHGVTVMQGWGMTETSPVGAVAHPPKDCRPEEEAAWRARSGRIAFGVELRLTDGDRVLPWDGRAIGEVEVRGPWITGSYYGEEAPEKFHDGWLKTGDVGTVDERGYLQITDRAKDVIKSGGEWISSVELENALMGHAGVMEAAVIGVPDERWDERPLACVVLKEENGASLAELKEYLAGRVARWWIPERWAFVAAIPKTSVGKFDKKVLRAQYAQGTLKISE